MKENDNKKIKLIKGTVVSDAMDKTVVVSVTLVKTHRLYHKKYFVNKKYKVHDENNQYKNGDIVEISSVKPISRDKHYKVINKVA
jgi:small subunit ribosomal protein S17